jgi:hypothetical protein
MLRANTGHLSLGTSGRPSVLPPSLHHFLCCCSHSHDSPHLCKATLLSQLAKPYYLQSQCLPFTVPVTVLAGHGASHSACRPRCQSQCLPFTVPVTVLAGHGASHRACQYSNLMIKPRCPSHAHSTCMRSPHVHAAQPHSSRACIRLQGDALDVSLALSKL